MINDIVEQRTSAAKSTDAAHVNIDALEQQIQRNAQALLAQQRPDGHWVFELEADATIPAEYVLLRHYLGEPVDVALEAKIAVYLRRIQGKHGSWPLFADGDLDVSATVKAYFALKLAGDSPDSAPMMKARETVHRLGGLDRLSAPSQHQLGDRFEIDCVGFDPTPTGHPSLLAQTFTAQVV